MSSEQRKLCIESLSLTGYCLSLPGCLATNNRKTRRRAESNIMTRNTYPSQVKFACVISLIIQLIKLLLCGSLKFIYIYL